MNAAGFRPVVSSASPDISRPAGKPAGVDSGPSGSDQVDLTAKFVEILVCDLPEGQDALALKKILRDIERMIIVKVLAGVHGNQRRAALILGLKPTTLFEKARRYKIRIEPRTAPLDRPSFHEQEVDARTNK